MAAKPKIISQLRELGVINAYDFYTRSSARGAELPDLPVPPQIAGLPQPLPRVVYSPAVQGRVGRSAEWRVVQYGVHLDPDCHWMSCGIGPNGMHDTKPMVFAPHRHRHGGTPAQARAAARDAALAWAAERWPEVAEWAEDPWGSYAPAEFIKQRLAQLLPTHTKGGNTMSEQDLTQDPKLGKAAQAAAKEQKGDAPAAAAPAVAAEPKVRKDGSPRLPRGTASDAERQHKAAYDAYVAARAEGDQAGMEANREGYRAYKRAGRERREAARAASTPAA